VNIGIIVGEIEHLGNLITLICQRFQEIGAARILTFPPLTPDAASQTAL
jgi:hypothetical protein